MSPVFYLGPAGTFTHDAARRYFEGLPDDAFEPCETPPEVMRRLTDAGCGHGVVPIENSVHGEVIPTLDALCFERADIFVVGEVSLPIAFDLFAIAPDAAPRRVLSHPHALAQCRRLIAERGLREQAVASTAEACRLVQERRDPELCALAAASAGERFGLATLASAVGDVASAATRFLVVGDRLSIDAEADRTMLALLPAANGVGVLAEFAGAFADAGVNIFDLHVRPLRNGPGQYLFILSVSGSPLRQPTQGALARLLSKGYLVKLLGAYRAWRGVEPAAPWPSVPGLLDAAGLERLLSGGGRTRSVTSFAQEAARPAAVAP